MKDITESHARLRGLFNITVTPFKVDGAFDHAGLACNIERVIARLYALATPLPVGKVEIARYARALTPAKRAGDFAQALMDLGATICTPKKPACALCPWNAACVAHARDEAELFPRRAPKREGALRRGAAFVARRADDCVLLRTRPARGLLGGMTEVPSTAWTHKLEEADALAQAPLKLKWRRLPGVVEHGFTHFPLQQSVYVATAPAAMRAPSRRRARSRGLRLGRAAPSLASRGSSRGSGACESRLDNLQHKLTV